MAKQNTVYINYLDSNNKFKETRKEFKTFEDAVEFMNETFDTVNTDFINYI